MGPGVHINENNEGRLWIKWRRNKDGKYTEFQTNIRKGKIEEKKKKLPSDKNLQKKYNIKEEINIKRI